nr:catalase family protein [Chelatococcus sambhunathii]
MAHVEAVSPLPFAPAMEHHEEHEEEIRDELIATLRSISETTLADTGHGLRSVHAKSHALVVAEAEVLDGLPPELAQGLFATPGRYKALMRFSTNPGDVLHDAVSAPRGLGLKLVGVRGERLPGSEGQQTQDFLMADAPAFAAPNAATFLKNLKLIAKTTDRAEGAKKALSGVLRLVEAGIEAFGGKSATIVALGGHPLTHVLSETYFSQTAFLYGANVAKFSVAPVSAELLELKGRKIDVSGHPDAHREAVNAFFAERGGEWELRVQLMTDADAMPIEDASVAWDEKMSPYLPVARIRAEPQQGWSADKSKAMDDGLSFSPWRGLAAHRPLGSINRVRRENYARSVAFRSQANGCPIREPKADAPSG